MIRKILSIFTLCAACLTVQAQVIPDLPPFDGIDAKGNFRLSIHSHQTDCRVELLATPEVAKQIAINVQDHILFIKDQRPNHAYAPRLTVIVSAPSINYLHLSGMTFGTMASLESAMDPSLNVHLSGASQFKPSGSIKQLTLHNSGAGQLQGSDLTTQTAAINVSGHSRSLINASKQLTGYLSGMSLLHYHGNPERSLHVSGRAKVTPIQ